MYDKITEEWMNIVIANVRLEEAKVILEEASLDDIIPIRNSLKYSTNSDSLICDSQMGKLTDSVDSDEEKEKLFWDSIRQSHEVETVKTRSTEG